MREIKFRAKNKRYNEWSYGYYWCNYSINNGNLFEETHYIKEIIDDERFNIRDWEVNKETVGQYTGLKDKNGKEIYEGDIVRVLGGYYEQGFYEFDEKCTIKDIFDIVGLYGDPKDIEVIGNIYDNPDLLEKGKEE